METFTCYRCRTPKPLNNFHKDPKQRSGHSPYCRDCKREQKRNYNKSAKAHATKFRLGRKHRLAKFGLTQEEYDRLHTAQNGLCAICHNPERRQNYKTKLVQALAVDHCHSTNKVRALLCGDCNSSLGLMGEDIPRFYAAIEYLLKHRAS